MGIVTGFNELSSLWGLPFDSKFTQIIAPIAEVYPAGPAPGGGSRQQIRIAMPHGGVVDVHLFDQSEQVQVLFQGGVIRMSASPNAQKALVWERSKSEKPSSRMGAIIVRKQATVEVFTSAQAVQRGVTLHGFTLPAPPAAPEPAQPPARAATAFPVPAPQAPAAGGPIKELTEKFALCLQSARDALGNKSDPEDVRATARAVFERLS